jgi:hypothetical protein
MSVLGDIHLGRHFPQQSHCPGPFTRNLRPQTKKHSELISSWQSTLPALPWFGKGPAALPFPPKRHARRHNPVPRLHKTSQAEPRLFCYRCRCRHCANLKCGRGEGCELQLAAFDDASKEASCTADPMTAVARPPIQLHARTSLATMTEASALRSASPSMAWPKHAAHGPITNSPSLLARRTSA